MNADLTCCKGACREVAVSEYHWPVEQFGAPAVSFFCAWHERDAAYDRFIAALALSLLDRSLFRPRTIEGC